jgi:type II secretion system protein C
MRDPPQALRPWRWLAVVIGVVLGVFAAYLYWPHLQPKIDEPQAAQAVASSPVPNTAPAVVPEPIMGDPKLGVLGTDASISNEPLPLVLVGTIPGRHANEGTAMIGTDARNAQTYLAGAILHNGTRLAEVHRDRVVLTRDKRRAVLYLQNRGPNQGKAQPDPLLMVGGSPPQMASITSPPPSSIDSVSDYVRTVPVYEGDIITGFQVFPGARKSVFSKWGLRPGDVVTSLDGAALVDADQTQQLLSALGEGAAISASVRRDDGSVAHVTLNGADILQLNEGRRATALAAQMPPN